MKIIDMQVVFDAESIIGAYGNDAKNSNPGNPVPIDHHDIYMVVSSKYLQVLNTQGTPDLNIRAEVGDEIRWAGITLSENISYSVTIYDIFETKDGKKNDRVTSKPMPKLAHAWVPVPTVNAEDEVDPLSTTPEKFPEYYLSCDVTDYGIERYSVKFYISKHSYGDQIDTLGYFVWDPTITVM